ncbi:ABC transporter ATP-binding protein [Rathayibacter tanaceti]|uniref:ATP-binding cassette domain-containing protein n=2 Tax=Rathayibacter tanaceti TaxID=1671680 RepID=A0A162GGI9_9MICO|nr:ATP-binding cassette domain-containing protein [Rathayibacter tanaceti]KZX20779.1 Taurine import ATP-binding protein TauB [Rathayibacter tanaceti]QHC56075.1 ATP-binding cassette domain-containing protein [Rathayibacter tanaceti]TCO39067.1 putative ABC transport system ATP-binding protein/lipoprotein-releasing system ATP-binding protein [Rathayibacter tanaceti]
MLIDASDVTVDFGGRPILRAVSLSLEAGETLALRGPSGAGKSTLLGVLAGQVRPSEGTVRSAPPERTAWILQSTPVLTRRSVLDNVALGALALGSRRRAAEAAALDALRQVGIAHLGLRPVHELSGGERQRTAVARAVVAGSALILADEPTASLDPGSRALVVDALLRAAASGAGVVVATHDSVVAAACGRIARLDGGVLLEMSGELDE